MADTNTATLAHDYTTELQIKAAQHVANAEKVLKRPTYWGLLRTPEDNYEDAAHAYHQAANTYKLLKEWDTAYRYYMAAAKYTAGNIEISNLDRVSDAIKTATLVLILQAAESLEHFDRQKAVKLYTTIANIYITLNNYDKAANTTAYSALMLRTIDEPMAAIAAYKQAAEYYEISHNPYRSKITDCWDNMAKIYMEQAAMTHYPAPASPFTLAREACDIYKQIAIKNIAGESSLVSFRIYEPLFKSLICMFYCEDSIAIRNRYDEYCRMYPTFETINDGVFLGKLIKCVDCIYGAMDKRDIEKYCDNYRQLCRERELVKPLDGWMIGPLLYQLTHAQSVAEKGMADNVDDIDLS